MPRLSRYCLAALAAVFGLSSVALAAGEGWSHDVDASLKKATDEKKHVLMDFTGSDWCGWCIKLNEEVFSQEHFKSQAPQQFVLVELDFPRDKSKLSDETQAQNQQWQQKLGIRGFPTIVLLTADGEPYAQTGYRPGGPESYMEHLNELKAMKTQADELRAKAEKAEGVEKAKLYDQLLQMANEGLIVNDAEQLALQVIELDANNEAGLKSKYTVLQRVAEVQEAVMQGPAGMEKAQKLIDATFADLNPEGEGAQILYLMQAQLQFNRQEKDAALESLNKALAAAPEGAMADRIKQIKAQVFPDAE